MNYQFNIRKRPQGGGSDMVFGIRAVMEALNAGKEIDKIWIRKNLEGDLSRELSEVLKGYEIPVQRVPQEKLMHLSSKNHQGVVAFISPITYQRLDQLIPALYDQGIMPFVVVLDGITDVRNFGAIARTCACAGVHAVVLPQTGSVSVNADAIKTSAGALYHLPVCRERNLKESLRFLKLSGLKLIGASEKADKNYRDADYSGPLALVLGAEDQGIAPMHLTLCDEIVKIPVLGDIASLNVSVAGGILMYEALRHRD
ncbi:MAG: 23S rRNA (guanosine(2251)-2'-O)-methyltransferase RlmB [Bacteroidales bacterium]|nr:23S rRNA (guanosine(2251)-2'-O)-methyltransferase RlmB [Bacteroidales bacterium]MDD4361740.1 23S rRNA (guanosine(2251)-2'-O)-methyltransferase RlmB [Bacteroidales bacterium]MDD4431699.1 23S rRNA (guanosine(2251)-2'-O)-methyltransferase RlmB [Bacteroidales bacterium]